MGNRAIGLVLVAKTPRGWRRLPVVMGSTGRLKGQHGLVEGKPVYFPGSYYALRSYEGPRQVFRTLGPDASRALAELSKEQRRRTAKVAAENAEDMILVDRRETRVDLYERRDAWLDRLRARGKTRPAETMATSIGDFLRVTGLRYSDELTEDSIIVFYEGLRKRGKLIRRGRPTKGESVAWYRGGEISDRTVFNKSADIAGRITAGARSTVGCR